MELFDGFSTFVPMEVKAEKPTTIRYTAGSKPEVRFHAESLSKIRAWYNRNKAKKDALLYHVGVKQGAFIRMTFFCKSSGLHIPGATEFPIGEGTVGTPCPLLAKAINEVLEEVASVSATLRFTLDETVKETAVDNEAKPERVQLLYFTISSRSFADAATEVGVRGTPLGKVPQDVDDIQNPAAMPNMFWGANGSTEGDM